MKKNLENITSIEKGTFNVHSVKKKKKVTRFSCSAERDDWDGIFLAFVHLKIRVTPFMQPGNRMQ